MMKQRISAALLTVAMLMALAGQAVAVELPSIFANGEAVTMDAPVDVMDGTTYVSYWPIVKAFYPDAVATWESDRAVVRATNLTLELQPGAPYLVANGRYLYVPENIQTTSEGILTLPVRTLALALGVDATWDAQLGAVMLTANGTGPIKDASLVYPQDVLHWMSRIINAESGNQPLSGKIAVGNVIMNRVNSPLFPNTVYEVIHQSRQFTPVSNGSINKEPNAQSVIAAKLVLEGVNTAGHSLYFINPRVSGGSWVARTRTLVTTIANHAFYC